MDYSHLKSGSDIRGEAIAAPGVSVTLTEAIARRVGHAFVLWLAKKQAVSARALIISVGRDSRLSGPSLAAAVMDGAIAAGARVLNCGLCTTPAMFMTTVSGQTACQGAVMVTASHHPWTRNGLKFFTARGGIGGEDVRELLALAGRDEPPAGAGAPPEETPFLPIYAESLKAVVREGLSTAAEHPLAGLRVAVDAGNGAGGFYARMLEELGADTAGSRYLEPDGRFPHHIPNPEDASAMEAICEAVRSGGADIGVIFDADCDRAAIVAAGGEAVNRNRLIALASAMVLEGRPGAAVVTDSVTSTGLTKYIGSLGGRHVRFKRGYRNVIDEAARLNTEGFDCPLAMETSGHAALRENHFLDDGMYLVTRLLVLAMRCREEGRKLSDLIADLAEPAETTEIRLAITAPDFAAAGRAALARMLDASESWPSSRLAPDNHEGFRVLFDLWGGEENAWVMMRLSVHDPVLAINAESDVPGGVAVALGHLAEALDGCEDVDCAPLRQRLDT